MYFQEIKPTKPGFTVGEVVADIRNELKEVSLLFCPKCKKIHINIHFWYICNRLESQYRKIFFRIVW
ncbi:hypothetical protein SAMN05444392_11911 [Seinonella peptonophila]|uniref:Uncharacterized protein n=1 Tax=Seinonella peptonophila TaxID=112248 RepID=A0A1M5B7Q6_9BACL|nr:hypothetical protein SAMN05444392_11911 [Seinonella peptonophila]